MTNLYPIREYTQNKPQLILRKLLVSDREFDPQDRPRIHDLTFMRRKYQHHIPKSLEELKLFKDKHWIWVGQYSPKPRYKDFAAVRVLYDIMKLRVHNQMRLYPRDPKLLPYDVNPFKYRFANGYEENMEGCDTSLLQPTKSETPISEDLQDCLDLIPEHFPDETPSLDTIYETFRGLYDKSDIEKAAKILGRSFS